MFPVYISEFYKYFWHYGDHLRVDAKSCTKDVVSTCCINEAELYSACSTSNIVPYSIVS